jgi:manganese oxidase
MNANSTWRAWTYNGTVPGPTLHIRLGDNVQVHVINRLNLTHSWHMHYVGYNFTDDGSPANTIMNEGAGGMIPPGGSYTYNFTARTPGLFFYHDHSADHYPVMYMVAQGLYGTMIVDDSNTPKLDHDWTIMMAEIGAQVSGTNAPYYIMDGKGFTGGEGGLDTLYAQQGFAGIQAQINKTLLTFSMKVGQTARLDLVNIGDQTHTFHLHDIAMISEWWNPGQMWPAEVVPLDPGVAQAVIIQPTQPGLWLFHCHVLGHEDISMVGALLVTK